MPSCKHPNQVTTESAHTVPAPWSHLPRAADYQERPLGPAAQACWLVAQQAAFQKLPRRAAAAPKALEERTQQRRAGQAAPPPCRHSAGEAVMKSMSVGCRLAACCWVAATCMACHTTHPVACSLPWPASPGLQVLRWWRSSWSSKSAIAAMAGKAAPLPSVAACRGSASSCSRPCDIGRGGHTHQRRCFAGASKGRASTCLTPAHRQQAHTPGPPHLA